jgi:hypothetical protein
MRIWKALALLAVPAALVTSAVTATAASASTPGCTGGPWLGYCATQADDASPALVIDAKGQKAAYNNPVIGWTDSTTDPATDWFQLAYAGDSTLGVMFAFAPGGAISDWCMSDPGNGQVVERQCNGSNWQRWIATQGRLQRVLHLDQPRDPPHPERRYQGCAAHHYRRPGHCAGHKPVEVQQLAAQPTGPVPKTAVLGPCHV